MTRSARLPGSIVPRWSATPSNSAAARVVATSTSSGDRPPFFDESYGDAEFRNALNEFARAIQRIDDPDSFFAEARAVVDGFFGKPAFSFSQEMLMQRGVDGVVGFGDRIVSCFIFGCHGTRREAAENFMRRLQAGFDTFQDVCVRRSHKGFVTSPARAFARPLAEAMCKECGAATAQERACSGANPTTLPESTQSGAKAPNAGQRCPNESGENP